MPGDADSRQKRQEEFRRAEAALNVAKHNKMLEDTKPVNCPGCGIPIRVMEDTPFEAKGSWCVGCGGQAVLASPTDGDTVEVYAELLRMALDGKAAKQPLKVLGWNDLELQVALVRWVRDEHTN